MNVAPTSATAATASAIDQINGKSKNSAASQLTSAAEQADRFLTLLVTQMKNQDPLNPMDNAQITTQMAQISTVSGIDKLSAAVGGMNGLLTQMQSLEAASLVGKDVLVEGHRLALDEDGVAGAGFDLAAQATSVVVSVKDASGKLVDTLDMGSMPAGRHSFEWQSVDPKLTGLTFEVTARNGAATVGLTRLMADRVAAVYSENGQLSIELARQGNVRYSEIKGVS